MNSINYYDLNVSHDKKLPQTQTYMSTLSDFSVWLSSSLLTPLSPRIFKWRFWMVNIILWTKSWDLQLHYIIRVQQCILAASLVSNFLTHSKKLLSNFKIFYLVKFSTDWLTLLLINALDNCNSIIAVATGLISSLFNVTSSGDMPFCKLLQFQCLHHGSTETYLCFPL